VVDAAGEVRDVQALVRARRRHAEVRRRRGPAARPEASAIIESFRHFNEVRPHSSLGYLTPAEFKQQQESARHNQTGEAVL
jgi:transposase InsO family protein